MSNKGTPVNSRLSKLQTPSSRLKSTPKSNVLLNHPIFRKKLSEDHSSSPAPSSANKFKPRTPALNACYTPSSLYKTTPVQKKPLSVTKKSEPRATLEDTDSSEISNLTVAVRVRPLNSYECMNKSVTNIVQVRGSEITIYGGTTADNSAGVSHSFHYDYAFSSKNSEPDQEAVFLGTGLPLIEKAFEGGFKNIFNFFLNCFYFIFY